MSDEKLELSDEQLDSVSGGTQEEIDAIRSAILRNPKLAPRLYRRLKDDEDEVANMQELLNDLELDIDIHLDDFDPSNFEDGEASLEDVLNRIRNY